MPVMEEMVVELDERPVAEEGVPMRSWRLLVAAGEDKERAK